jgi:hypothetical protein
MQFLIIRTQPIRGKYEDNDHAIVAYVCGMS